MLPRSAHVQNHRQSRQLIQKRRQARGRRPLAHGSKPASPQRQPRPRQAQPLQVASNTSAPLKPPRAKGTAQQRLRSKREPPSGLAPQHSPPQQRHLRRPSPLGRSRWSQAGRRPSHRPQTHQRSLTSGSSQRRPGFWIWGVRAVVAGFGGFAIAGTTVAILNAGSMEDSASHLSLSAASLERLNQQAPAASAPQSQEPQLQLRSDRELTTIKAEIQQLAAAQPGLTPGLFFYSPESGAFLDIAGDQPISAASTIKVPILIAFFQAVDAGKVHLNQPLVMRKDLVATEAGVMQYEPVGTQFSALETAELMITISDNTATNMLIDLLGGAKVLNSQFKAWGLTETAIQNQLPDLEGTNTISPKDLSMLMYLLSQGKLVSKASRDRALDILRQTVTDTLLPQGIAPEATIAHKTGDIGSVVGDTGLIEMPNGQRYVATVMVRRPHNDPRAQELIRAISRLTYDAFSQP